MKVVGSVIIKDGKILLAQEAYHKFRGQWSFPSGHIESGEKVIDAVIRETKEETGLDIVSESLSMIVNVTDEPDVMLMFFNAKVIGGEIKFDESEILDVKWFTFDEARKLNLRHGTKENLEEAIRRHESGQNCPLDVISELSGKDGGKTNG